MSNLFWIRSSNFGDALNPVLHNAIMGREPAWADPEKVSGTVIAIGSLAHRAYPGNVLWGTGAMADDMELHADSTTIAHAVRGPLTAWLLRKQGVNVSNAVFGDPAILIPRYFPPSPPSKEQDNRGLVIPHYVDVDRAAKYDWGTDWTIVSPMKSVEFLIQKISNAFMIITSSLHILIVAEAYDVPVIWAEFSDDVRGNGFKFWDYYLGTVRNPPTPVQIRGSEIPWNQINARFDDLQPPAIDSVELGDALLDVCPFE